MSRLQASKVTLTYETYTAVHEVSVTIPDGQITTIIGPNGCGKSTLLRALARLKKPDGGSVILEGQSIQHFPTQEVARKLGLLSQQASAPGGITVEDLVGRGRYPHQSFMQAPTEKDREAVRKALALAGMTDLKDRSVDELSGGQRQRAWIAMVLGSGDAHSPPGRTDDVPGHGTPTANHRARSAPERIRGPHDRAGLA